MNFGFVLQAAYPMPTLGVEVVPVTDMVEYPGEKSEDHPQVKRRRYGVNEDTTEIQQQATNRCLEIPITVPSPTNSQSDSDHSSPLSHQGSHSSESLQAHSNISPNADVDAAAPSVVYQNSNNSSQITNSNSTWIQQGEIKVEDSLNTSSAPSTSSDPNSPDSIYQNQNSDAQISSYSTDELAKPAITEYPPSQFPGSLYNNQVQMQVYSTVGSGQSSTYNMNSGNTTSSGYYNGQNGQSPSSYGVLSNSYSMPGSRMMNQSGKNGQTLTAQTSYLNPYSTFGPTAGGQMAGQTPSTYSAYGSTGYNTLATNAYSTGPVPNSQTFNTAQQGLDYSTFGGFGQTASYSYPCYHGQGYTSYVTGGSPGIQPMSTSATYQLTQIPPIATDALSDHHHYSIDENTSPPLKSDGTKPAGRKRAGRGPGRKQSNPSPEPENQLERVYLWDIDETLIIFHSLLTGSYAKKFAKDERLGVQLGLKMEELIFELADSNLFYTDLEEIDQCHIDDVSSDDNGQDLTNYNFQADGFMNSNSGNGNFCLGATVRGGVDCNRKLAFRYRRIKEIYTKYRNNVSGLLSPNKKDVWHQIRQEIEGVTDSWLTLALKCLTIIDSRPSCVNVLVTTTQLVPAISKVLLHGLGTIFPVENIYSAAKLGKEDCFQKVRLRFGKCTYVALGDGLDERAAAKALDFPFWPIATHSDLITLHDALIKEHM